MHPLLLRLVLSTAIVASPAAAQEPPAEETPDHAMLADPDGEPIVVGSVHRIASSVYGKEQVLTVRLPRGYADDAEATYPIVFSVDGGPNQDFEILAGIAAEAEFSTSFEPFILIGVKTDHRYSQLTPPSVMPEEMERQWEGYITPGGAPNFRRYLAEDVIPWAMNRYRGDRKVLTAASLGGLFVLDTFLETPDMFDDYIALTPSHWWDAGEWARSFPEKLATHDASDRRVWFTMGDEGVGNAGEERLETMVDAFENHAPEGLRWAFVDRSMSEEHRTMAMVSWLDAFRTLFLKPARVGNSLPMAYADNKKPTPTDEARANLDAGDCRHGIATPASWEQRAETPRRYYGMCLLTKPGRAPTAGNFGPGDFGHPDRRAD